MSKDGDNPYESPYDPAVAAPWRGWHVWWAASALSSLLVLPFLWDAPLFGSMIFIAVAAVNVRSLIDLQRKFEIGWSINEKVQLISIGQSALIVIAAGIGSGIAFVTSCMSIAIATETPMWHPVGEQVARGRLVVAIAYVIGVIAFGLLVWLMGPPSKKMLQANHPGKKEATSPVEKGENHD
ncbi:hypothetical protein M4951_10630 [Blastopirellula sp. J2-11]|uniref:hypothetical protein n=1 Tax=Blastopirellula sp. J2-11 TaxID=2943192 RepID=UPI0021C633BE|nr:hypothetical protein [Blastopirellula sp. J2-11]UUO08746.1 hypothetical protein M4951_10630 [Blastopirellula sp. J2-11]